MTLQDATGTLSAAFVPAREEIVTHPAGGRIATADRGSIPVDERAYELWRIARGDPRMGVDFDAGSLPAESGLERLIDLTKGCFLGQESVAKIRNLGHPPDGPSPRPGARASIEPGAPVHASNGAVGRVTSAAPGRRGEAPSRSPGWPGAAADAALSTGDGEPLIPGRD